MSVRMNHLLESSCFFGSHDLPVSCSFALDYSLNVSFEVEQLWQLADLGDKVAHGLVSSRLSAMRTLNFLRILVT